MASTRPRRARRAKAPLSEDAVVDAGLAILQRSGLEAVTMRAVAHELDTGAASLYVYVGGRDELYRMMFDRVFSGVEYPTPDPDRWREQLRDLCVTFLEVMQAHPGIATVAMGSIPLGPSAMDGAEQMMSLLLAGGIDVQRAAWTMDSLFLIVVANAVEEIIAGGVQHGTGLGGVPVPDYTVIEASFRELDPERYPNVTRHAGALFEGEKRERFLFAIDTFVDGVVAANGREVS